MSRHSDSPAHRLSIAVVVPKSWHAPELARAWAEDGHDVVVLTTMPDAFPGVRVRRMPTRTVTRVAGRLRPGTTWGQRVFTTAAAATLRREAPDVVVAWSGTGLGLPIAGRRAVLVRGNHHIATQREILASAPPGTWRPSEADVLRETAEYASWPVVTVPTQGIADDPRWGATAVHVSAYGFPPVSPSSTAEGRRSPDAASGARLVMVGEPAWRKGADRLRLLADLPSVERIELAGPGGDPSISHPKLVRLGGLDAVGVGRALARADAFVLLSREEGQARAGLEAMAAGLPLIVTPRTGLGDHCARGAGVVVPEDASADDLERAVSRVLALRDDMAATARAIARSRSWSDHAREVLDAATVATGPGRGVKHGPR